MFSLDHCVTGSSILPMVNSLSQKDERVNQSIVVDQMKGDVSCRADDMAKRFFEKQKKKELQQQQNIRATQMAQPWSSISLEAPPFPMVDAKPFFYDIEPYILTTESKQGATLEHLQSIPLEEGAIYLGFAFEFNYHLLSERNVKYAFIGDINKRMYSLYEFIQDNILKCECKDDFVRAFRNHLKEKQTYYFAIIENYENSVIEHYLNEEYSWLRSEDKFLRIKQLYSEGRIQHLNLDLVEDSSFFARLKTWMSFHRYHMDVIYVSNIPEWLCRLDSLQVTKMKANLLKIMRPQTLLIDAKQPYYESGIPELRVSRNIEDAESFPSFKPADRKSKKRRIIEPDVLPF